MGEFWTKGRLMTDEEKLQKVIEISIDGQVITTLLGVNGLEYVINGYDLAKKNGIVFEIKRIEDHVFTINSKKVS